MNGRAFLDIARELVAGATEAHWRAATGRAYYALMIECRDVLRKWGFIPAPRENVHTFVRLRFSFAADSDLKTIGDALDRLGQWRNKADYQLSIPGLFGSPATATAAVGMVQKALTVLDGIDQNPIRQKAAIAAIQP